jgi:hypothetical protein
LDIAVEVCGDDSNIANLIRSKIETAGTSRRAGDEAGRHDPPLQRFVLCNDRQCDSAFNFDP